MNPCDILIVQPGWGARTGKVKRDPQVMQDMDEYSTPDTTLLQQIAAGEEDALAILYDRYGGRLYAFALRILRDPIAAQDVLQESLITIWQKAKTYRGEGRVIAWLFSILHHKAMRYFRDKKKDHPLEDVYSVAVETDHSSGVISGDIQDQLREQILKLSIDHQTVLELVFFQGMTIKEVAQVCKVPQGTVKSRLTYAKLALKGFLTRDGIAPEDLR